MTQGSKYFIEVQICGEFTPSDVVTYLLLIEIENHSQQLRMVKRWPSALISLTNPLPLKFFSTPLKEYLEFCFG